MLCTNVVHNVCMELRVGLGKKPDLRCVFGKQ